MASDDVAHLLMKPEDRRLKTIEPEWESGSPVGADAAKMIAINAGDPVQQGDILKPFYMKVVKDGLDEAYKEYKTKDPFAPPTPAAPESQQRNTKKKGKS